MQFREQGKKIQCIRSTYDPASHRSHQKVVASFDRFSDSLPSANLLVLTDPERMELKQWFEARQSVRAERTNQYRIMGAASSLRQLGESIKIMGAVMTDSEAAATWVALADVAKALRKAGHSKPKRLGQVEVSSVQPDLLTDAV